MDPRPIDYLEKHHAVIVEEPGGGVIPPIAGTRVIVAGNDVFFADLAPDVVRSVVNAAMGVALPYYRENVARSELGVDETHVGEVALTVALYKLRVFNDWRTRHWFLRWKRLRITAATLRHPLSRDRVLWYCERVFGDRYALYAAALLGFGAEEFATWEAARQRFWEMW